MKTSKRFLILVAVSFILSLCKKEDVSKPLITVDKTLLKNNYSYGDTIPIKVSFSDTKQIKNYQVSILNSNDIPVLSVLSGNVNKSSFQLNSYIIVDNKSLASGVYTLKCWAANESTFNSVLITIKINELPLQLIDIFYVTHSTLGNFLSKANSDMSATPVFQINGVPYYSNVSSDGSLFLYSDKYPSDLRAVNLRNNQVLWLIPVISAQTTAFYKGVYVNGANIYVLYFDGTIEMYDNSGVLQKRFSITSAYEPIQACANSKYLAVIGKNKINGNANVVKIFNKETTGLMQQLAATTLPTNLFFRNDNSLLIMVNNNSLGYIEEYLISDNNWRPLHSVSENITDAVFVDENNSFISTISGIYWYSYSNNSLVPFGSGKANRLKYESLSKVLLAVDNKTISSYKFPENQLLKTATLTDSIMDVHFLYNK